MRDNGVREFPDPDASGQLTIDGIANGSSVNPNSAAFKQAISACKDLEPSGFIGHKRSPEQQKAALKFAQCIRDNGVKDFPDPTLDRPLIDTNRIPSSGTQGGMSILNAAMQKCRDFASGAGVTGGRGCGGDGCWPARPSWLPWPPPAAWSPCPVRSKPPRPATRRRRTP